MGNLNHMWEKLKGKKTYIVAVVMICYAIAFLGWYNGDWSSAGKMVLEAMGMAGLRNAL